MKMHAFFISSSFSSSSLIALRNMGGPQAQNYRKFFTAPESGNESLVGFGHGQSPGARLTRLLCRPRVSGFRRDPSCSRSSICPSPGAAPGPCPGACAGSCLQPQPSFSPAPAQPGWGGSIGCAGQANRSTPHKVFGWSGFKRREGSLGWADR